MFATELLEQVDVDALSVAAATVCVVGQEQSLVVRLPSGRECSCEVLANSREAPSYAPGDRVLVAFDPAVVGQAIILGRIANPEPVDGSESRTTVIEDRHIVVRAGETLTLQCGQGTLRIEKDGKVVIKGDRLLSRARTTNRIKGGRVDIN